MKIQKIIFPDELKVVIDGSMEVSVQDDEGYTFTVFVSTPQDLLQEMVEQQTNFVRPDIPKIIVKELTKKIVREGIHAYAENEGYWLKLHQFANAIDISVFDKLQAEDQKYLEELDELD